MTRLPTLLFCFALPALVLTGCNADPGARREIALLKAEILDLEDNYYALLATNGNADGKIPGREPLPPRRRLRDRMRLGMTELSLANRNYDAAVCDEPDGFTDGEIVEEWQGESTPGMSDGAMRSFNHDGTGDSQPWTTEPQNQPDRVEPVPMPQTPEEIDIGSPPTDNDSAPVKGANRNPGSLAANQASARGKPSGSNPGRDNDRLYRVSALELIEDMTIGIDITDDGIDDGIRIGFRLLDQSGRPLNSPAKVIFSLLDPSLPNGQQRLGLWEHAAGGQGPLLPGDRSSAPQQVILKWQQAKPLSENLLLFARHVLADGSAIEKSIQVDVKTGSSGQVDDEIPLSASGNSALGERTTRRAAGEPTSRQDESLEINVDVEQLESQNNRRAPWRAVR